MDDVTEQRIQLQRTFSEFLDGPENPGNYPEKIKQQFNDDNVRDKKLRLLVDLQDLQDFSRSLHGQLVNSPGECLAPFEEALAELVRHTYPKLLQENDKVHVGFEGELGANRVGPRQLSARLLSKLVEVDGIVTKTSTVRPKVMKSVHYCEVTKTFLSREYRDVTSHSGLPTQAVYPTKDDRGNPLVTEFGLCVYKDHQRITLQELPETAPPGQMPRSIEVLVEDDLVDRCKPGDRVACMGVYRAVAPRAAGATAATVRSVVVCNAVRTIGEASSQLYPQDFVNAEALARRPDVLDLLARSLAPSIHGHDTIKRGLVLLLLGGRERVLDNGTHLRGDLNCLLVGDPGVAKSQLLRAVMAVAPLAVSTTGRGSSGVGLTAAITYEADSGERKLEAGAMVLADRGVVCIDEFDKMQDGDRVAIHEVMEQQTVTIAKAGVQTSLNARCSVVAAANPLYGSYDHKSSVTRNINLPDSLLSRFDLLFVVLDNLGPAADRQIGRHVLGQHRYRSPGETGWGVLRPTTLRSEEDRVAAEAASRQRGAGDVFVSYDARLYGADADRDSLPLTTDALRRYIEVARHRGRDLGVSVAAQEAIQDFYAELREQADVSDLPITVRTLETILRLSTAAAKARLAMREVDVQDVAVARELVQAMLDGNLADGGAQRGPRGGGPDPLGEDEASDAEGAPRRRTGGGARSRGRRGGTRTAGAGPPAATEAADPIEDEEMPEADPAAGGGAAAADGTGEGEQEEGAPPRLAPEQRAGVVAVLRELLVRETDDAHTLDALLARLRAAELDLPEAAVEQVLLDITAQHQAGAGSAAAPVMYDAEERTFFSTL